MARRVATGFDAIDESENGIWADSDAVKAMGQYHKKHTPLGLEVGRTCERCVVEVTSLISWPEVFCVSNKVFPQEVGLDAWAINDMYHVMHPAVMCPKCAGDRPTPVFFPLGPTEAQNEFSRAAKSRIIDPQQANIIRQIAARVKQLAAQRQ